MHGFCDDAAVAVEQVAVDGVVCLGGGYQVAEQAFGLLFCQSCCCHWLTGWDSSGGPSVTFPYYGSKAVAVE